MRANQRARVFPVVAILVASSWAAGCNKGTPVPVVGPAPQPIPPATSVIKIVSADTPFVVELVTELSSVVNTAGEQFRARIVTPLEAEDGDTVVTADSQLVGRVVDVRPAPQPAILVRFDAIETRWGPRALHATFTRTQPQASVVGDRARFEGYDGAIQAAPGIPLLTSDYSATAQAIELPTGARLRMVLTDPLAIRALEPAENFAPPSP
jgi:hypothetical protein